MPLPAISTLSDDSDNEQKSKGVIPPKAKAEGSKATVAAVAKPKLEPKPKTLPKAKENAEKKVKKENVKKPAASASASSSSGLVLKKPAAAEPVMAAKSCRYQKLGTWGIKYGGRQIFRLGP